MNPTFYSNGKVLLTGEYVVLDNANALALPCKFGQYLTIKHNSSNTLQWTSLDHNDTIWYEGNFTIHSNHITPEENDAVSKTLADLLTISKQLNQEFLIRGVQAETKLTFSKDFGLGSSSTLIDLIAQWAQVNPYDLLWKGFSGSGYDIACATAKQAITYQINNKEPIVTAVDFSPEFKDQLFFVYLNKKQNSREGISRYKEQLKNIDGFIKEINRITSAMITTTQLAEFEKLIDQHESIISKLIELPTVKSLYFQEYSGAIKSLGAWGGDFILATGDGSSPDYFRRKGYNTIFRYDELILDS
ncbi:MAG: GHMP kinase [Flavobacteriaceae bacterium]|nr:GHMP kinase [Flavobacteriaceae bacterium]